MKSEKCKTCKFHNSNYMYYPCRKCDGDIIPVTCKACRYYGCKKTKNGKHLEPCDDFEWD